jgi:hypothetical protein
MPMSSALVRLTLISGLADETVSIIDCPVNYSENMKLMKQLKELVSPV